MITFERQKIMLIGAGTISRHHAEAYAKLPHLYETALCVTDLNEQTLREFSSKFPEAHACSNVEEMLALPINDQDIVIIATPPSTHYQLTMMALRSGRHVLCEKPLAMNRSEAEEMARTAEKAGLQLACCSSRFLDVDTTNRAKSLLQNGELGDIYHVQFEHKARRSRPGVEYLPSVRWFLNSAVSGGGCLVDWGPYDFTTLNDILDPVQIDVLSAWKVNPETVLPSDIQLFDVEEHAGATLCYHMKDGKNVIVDYERAACTHGKEFSNVQIEGTKGAVSWDWLCFSGEGEFLHAFDEDGKVKENKVSVPVSGITYMEKPLIFFDRSIRGVASHSVVNQTAVFNYSVIEAIYQYIETGQKQTVRRDQ